MESRPAGWLARLRLTATEASSDSQQVGEVVESEKQKPPQGGAKQGNRNGKARGGKGGGRKR